MHSPTFDISSRGGSATDVPNSESRFAGGKAGVFERSFEGIAASSTIFSLRIHVCAFALGASTPIVADREYSLAEFNLRCLGARCSLSAVRGEYDDDDESSS